MSSDRASFGITLRQLRQAAALSQEELANRSGLSVRGISDLERGVRRTPHLETVRTLAEALALNALDRQILTKAACGELTSPTQRGKLAALAPLPAQLTPLVGRERELSHLKALLDRPKVRLVTMTGTGGTGKTRLAVQAAADLLGEFSDGAAFVDLSALNDPSLVLPAIGSSLGVREEHPVLADRIASVLVGKRLLLILDNFERVIAAAPVVSDLLASCPLITVLVTSREPLRLSGEQVFPVPPLTLPDRVTSASVEWLMQSEAAQLFIERAQAMKPEFTVSPDNAAAIAEICSWLEGLPLAIELAAARITVLSPAALLLRLERRLPLLTGGPRDQPMRLRTMRDAIAWSYDLLEEPEQTLFRRLAVFVGGFSLESAQVVSDTKGSGIAFFECIASLIAKSLLRQEEGAGDEPRFRMLETVREYGLERLAACGDEKSARSAHAHHYLALARQSFAGVHSRDYSLWMTRTEAEHNNFRSALTWLLSEGDAETAQALTGALYRFWYVRGHLSEGLSWAERALVAQTPISPAVRSWALLAAAWLAWATGDYHLAFLRASAAHELFMASQAAAGVAESLYVLGVVAEDSGDYASAETHLGEALARFRELDEPTWVGFTLNALGLVAYEHGDRTSAQSLFEEALTHFRAVGELHGTDFALTNLGKVALAAGDFTRAAAFYQESLTLRHEHGEQVAVAGCLRGLATVAAGIGQYEEAARLYGAAEGLRETIGLPTPRHRSRHDQSVAVTKAKLGEEKWHIATRAGRELPLHEAVTEALSISPSSGSQLPSTSDSGLTDREREVLQLLVSGFTDQRIAETLFVSRRTANTHVQHIYDKLGVNSRAEAAAAAVRRGLVPAGNGII